MTVLRRIPGQYLWPLIFLVSLCFGSVLALLYVTTSSQDRLESAREVHTLTAALDASVDMVTHDLQDYAKWDEAVRHIARNFDPDWIDDNVTAYLGQAQGYAQVLVIGPDDRSRYIATHGRRSNIDPIAQFGPAFVHSLAAVRRMNPAHGQPILSGFTRQSGTLYAYSVGAIVPLTGKVDLPPGEKQVLAIVDEVDPAFLERIRRTHQLPALSIRPDRGAVAIRDRQGHALAFVDMRVRRPGTMLRDQILPGLMVIGILAGGIAIFLIKQGSESIAELHASRRSALHHADHDPLTGLPNRRVLLETLRLRLEAKAAINLVYMDLDGFKEVNDLYGHRAGDELLREATARILASTDGQALVARMGGDEFAVLHGDAGAMDTGVLARKLIGAFAPTFAIGGAHVQIGASIGVVTTTPASDLDVDELMRRADVAMYSAKARGKNRWDSYAPDMDEGHDVRKRLETDLRAAIAAGKIDVAYQPIVSASTGEVVCLEALARWTHPREGAIPPDIFIPLAEMTGLIGALGEQVLAKACRAVAPHDLDLSVNLSPAQFWDAYLVDSIAGVLEAEGFPPHRLELEITENYLLRRPDAAAGVIEDLRQLGIRLALDDFGTGFASVGYLRQLRFDRLKIDKQFVRDATGDADAAELLVAIVALGRALRLEVTAEGVETEEQSALVRACGCHRSQGWLHGRPVPEAALAETIERMRRDISSVAHRVGSA